MVHIEPRSITDTVDLLTVIAYAALGGAAGLAIGCVDIGGVIIAVTAWIRFASLEISQRAQAAGVPPAMTTR